MILIFWFRQYSLHCVIQSVKQFKIHLVETGNESHRENNNSFDKTYPANTLWKNSRLDCRVYSYNQDWDKDEKKQMKKK